MTDIRPLIEAPPRKSRRQIQDQFRTLIRQAGELTEGLDAEALNRRPSPERWSPLECVEHLNATARLYLPVLTDAIQEARESGMDAASRRGPRGGSDGRTLLGRLVVWSQEPPPRFRMKTFEQIAPEAGGEEQASAAQAGEPAGGADPMASALDADAVLEEFEALHEELIVRINESGMLDRKKVKIRSTLDRRLKLSLEDWFWFLAAHARRHLWQAAEAAYGKER